MVQQPVPVLIAHPDLELVPGAAGVAVPPTEVERQVLVAEPGQVRVAGLEGGRARSSSTVSLLGPIRQALPVPRRDLPVADLQEGQEIVPLDVVILREDPAAHDVVEHVGQMMRRRLGPSAQLQAIGAAHDAPEVVAGPIEGLGHRRR